MMKTGKLLSASPVSGVDGEEFKQQTRTFKVLNGIWIIYFQDVVNAFYPKTISLQFGDLQVALTPGKAYTGAAIAFIFR